ncbi:alpha/beta fold hydrolase [bacterium]|nr:alpha/beta fold hydrolase [bacterium]
MVILRKISFVAIALMMILGLNYLINETTFLYKEPQRYEGTPVQEWLSPKVSPIAIKNNHGKAILFLHSFGSSPNDFRAYADYFSKEFDVFVPLLAGHGGTEDRFKNSYYTQWFKKSEDELTTLLTQYEEITVIGLSLGGLLTLDLASAYADNDKIKALVCIAAPVFLNNLFEIGLLHDWRAYLTRVISWFVDELEAVVPENRDGADRIGFEGKHFMKQIHSMKLGMKKVKAKLSLIKKPILLIHSKGDKSAPFENLNYIKQHVSSSQVEDMILDLRKWDHDRHLLTLYQTTREPVRNRLELFLNYQTEHDSGTGEVPEPKGMGIE